MSPIAVQRTVTWLDSRAVTRTIQMMAVLSLILALLVGVRQYRLASCLASYNDRASAATSQRAQASGDTNAAIDKVITSIANASLLPVADRKSAVAMAFQQYLKSRAAADEQRKENPIPPPPSETCR